MTFTKDKNPKHAFAYKKNRNFPTEVLDVVWEKNYV